MNTVYGEEKEPQSMLKSLEKPRSENSCSRIISRAYNHPLENTTCKDVRIRIHIFIHDHSHLAPEPSTSAIHPFAPAHNTLPPACPSIGTFCPGE